MRSGSKTQTRRKAQTRGKTEHQRRRRRLEDAIAAASLLVFILTLILLTVLTVKGVLILWAALAVFIPVVVICAALLVGVDPEREERWVAVGRFLRASQWVVPAEAMLVVGSIVRLRLPPTAGSIAFFQATAQIIPLLLIAVVLQEGGINVRRVPGSYHRWARGLRATWLHRLPDTAPDEIVRLKNEFADGMAEAQGLLAAFCVILLLLVGEGAALSVVFTEEPSDYAGAVVAGATAAGLTGVLVRIVAKPWDRSESGSIQTDEGPSGERSSEPR